MVVPDLRRIPVRRANHIVLAGLLALALAASFALAGCADRGPTFVEHGASYSKATALKLLAGIDISKIAQRPTSDADKLRHTALAALRRNGPTAAAAADLLIKTMPTNARGVPVYVELGSFGATPATILVEATGPNSGKLSTKRLWALGADGTVLFVATR
jgi:hypothetical protein